MSTVAPLLPTSNATRLRGWTRWDDDLSSWIDRHPARAFAALTGLYFVTVVCMSWVKLLWLDELITLHIARLNSVKAIWQALSSGADPNPPLIHLLVMWCRRLFGEHAWALRLPANFGYWVGMLSLFQFLRQRVSATWALTGVVFSMGMGGFQWSFESRSYALFYGFAMLALYCWSLTERASSPSRRYVATAGLALALAAGICSNYFAVLAFVPIAAAELTRTIQTVRRSSFLRAVRWSIWVAMAAAISPMLVFRPMIERSVNLYADYAWNKVSIVAAMQGYTQIVEWIAYAIVGFAILAGIFQLLRHLDQATRSRLRPRWVETLASGPEPAYGLLSAPEAAAISVLIAYPFVGYFVASLRGGMLSPRFVIPVCFGVAIAGVLFAYRALGQLRASGTIVLALALCWFALRTGYCGWVYEVQKESFERLVARIPPPDFPGQPLVVSDNLMLLPLEYYGRPSDVARLVYPIDFPGIMQGRGEASGEINLWYGRGSVYQFRIVPLATLQNETSTYIIVTSGREWLVADLLRHGYIIQPILVDTQSVNTDDFVSALTHARPVFFRATGDLFPNPYNEPMPFDLQDNLPVAK